MTGENERKAITIFIEPSLHLAMKKIARNNQRHIGATYNDALEMYVNHVNNYPGKQSKKDNKLA